MALRRPTSIQHLYRSLEIRKISSLFGSSRSYSNFNSKVPGLTYRSILNCSRKDHGYLSWIPGSANPLRSAMGSELSAFVNDMRLVTTQAKAPPQIRQMGALQVSMVSPGFVYEPYAPREPIPFWRRWFTRSGWKRTKEDIIIELKNAYAIAKLRKAGYSKKQFYQEAVQLYKEINTLMANGDKKSLRKVVTDRMYSALKNEIKQRESMWSSVYWELIEPVVKIRTLRARLIGIDRNDLNKVFVQLTLEFLAKQVYRPHLNHMLSLGGEMHFTSLRGSNCGYICFWLCTESYY
uniref:Large ribosomal subunit protein mL45 n=1 Tax=Nelumbo nucifera TaxID=4432 RepID=A0A822XJX8_NELNU|nr:TPA_asm: hypothetical protein HUJ06_020842 [Nelumbo nucifera]